MLDKNHNYYSYLVSYIINVTCHIIINSETSSVGVSLRVTVIIFQTLLEGIIIIKKNN